MAGGEGGCKTETATADESAVANRDCMVRRETGGEQGKTAHKVPTKSATRAKQPIDLLAASKPFAHSSAKQTSFHSDVETNLESARIEC